MTIDMFGNPTSETAFDSIPDGEYYAIGIEKFISKDDNDNPCYVVDQFHKELVVKFELTIVGNDLGAACTRTASQFVALASTLGADITKVNAKNRMSSATLTDLAEAVNTSDKQVKVRVRDGWVRWADTDLPESLYTVKFVGAHRADYTEGLEFLQGEFNPSLVFDFEVVGNGRGQPSVWDGHTFGLYMADPFMDSIEVYGEIITARENKRPIFQRHEKNPDTSTVLAERWKMFIKYFVPEVMNHQWETSPAKSEYGVDEIASPQYVIVGEAKKAGKTNVLQYRKRKKRRSLDLLELESLNSAEYVEDEADDMLTQVIDFIEVRWGLWEGKAIFDFEGANPGTFTEAGKEWAKVHLQPAWDQADLGAKQPLHTLAVEQLEKLLVAFEKLYPQTVDENGEEW